MPSNLSRSSGVNPGAPPARQARDFSARLLPRTVVSLISTFPLLLTIPSSLRPPLSIERNIYLLTFTQYSCDIGLSPTIQDWELIRPNRAVPDLFKLKLYHPRLLGSEEKKPSPAL